VSATNGHHHLEQSVAKHEIARRILDKWRPQIPCFNDDVQGTGCVTLAAILAGLHVSKQKQADLRMVVFGAGTAGVGIADQVRDAIATERGISKDEAAKQIWYVMNILLSHCPRAAADKFCWKAHRQARAPNV
jgi:malic enzyme